MPVLQYTALLLDTASVPKLASMQPVLRAALTRCELSLEQTLFQLVWHPAAPGLTLITVFENGELGGEGFELWGSDLGKKLAKALGVRTWELQLTGGMFTDQTVLAYDAKGKQRWRSKFDGQLPAKIAAKAEDPFVPLAEARGLVANALKTLGAARIEDDAGLSIDAFVDIEHAHPSPEAQAITVKVTDAWAKALRVWNKKRPAKAVKRPVSAAGVEPPVPFEVGVCWVKASPGIENEALLFLHDVARAEGLKLEEWSVTVHRAGKSGALLRCVPDPKRIAPGMAELFVERLGRLVEPDGTAQAAVVVRALAPQFFTHAQIGPMSAGQPMASVQLEHFMRSKLKFSLADLYERKSSIEATGALFESGYEATVAGKPFGRAQWKLLLGKKTDAEREKQLARFLGRDDIEWAPFLEQVQQLAATLQCRAPVRATLALTTKAVEAHVGPAHAAKLRKQWNQATKARVDRGPMMGVSISSGF